MRKADLHIKPQAGGFSLLEMAIALVIIGLLLGGVMRAQELLTGARVRNFVAQEQGVKTAFFAFQDRYRALPGDYSRALIHIPGATQNGNGNGRIEANPLPDECILAWEHLSRAGLIERTYTYSVTESEATSPANPYGGYQRVIFDGVYGDPSLAMPPKHNLKLGAQIPAYIAAEVDRKIDDGLPYRGQFQFSIHQGNVPAAPIAADCVVPGSPASWRVAGGGSNCGAVSLL
jgi:prepilin-type N-terminal cleavage/methylation domain-containing protein